MIVILLGPPGSGKGTHSELLCRKYGLFAVSTGEILRQRASAQDEVAKQMKKIMQEGKLFDDNIINDFLTETVMSIPHKTNYNGMLCDGYPRTVSQAKFLDNILTQVNMKVNCAFVLKIADDAIIDRLTARRVDKNTGKIYNLKLLPPPEGCDLYQRDDDTAEAIKTRIVAYHKQTEPLIDYYSQLNVLEYVDAVGKVDEIQEKLESHLSHLALV